MVSAFLLRFQPEISFKKIDARKFDFQPASQVGLQGGSRKEENLTYEIETLPNSLYRLTSLLVEKKRISEGIHLKKLKTVHDWKLVGKCHKC